jgi:hypothetical protein
LLKLKLEHASAGQRAAGSENELPGAWGGTGAIRDNCLHVGPVDPRNPDPDDPGAYMDKGTAAFITEGGNLVFAIGQSAASSGDTILGWSLRLSETGGQSHAFYDNFDVGRFNTVNGDGEFEFPIVTIPPGGGSTWRVAGKATIPAGSRTSAVRIPTLDGSLFKGDEPVVLEFFDPTNKADLVSLAGTGRYGFTINRV